MQPDLRSLRELEHSFYRAPSAHNTQPWLLDYTPGRIDLRFDPDRHLAAGDPTRRDLLLGLGAFVEAVLIVAASEGVALTFDAVPSGEEVGRFVTADGPFETPFMRDDVERRQTSRLGYRPGRLEVPLLAAARRHLGEREELHELPSRDVLPLFAAADRQVYESQPVVAELRRWLRLSKRHPDYFRDGLTYECLGLSAVEAQLLALLLRPRVFPLVRAARLHRLFASAGTALLDVDGSMLVLERAGDDERELLESGRTLLRVWLELSRAGVFTHPLSQIIDHSATEAELARRIDLPEGRRILCVFRAGRSEPPPRSQRLA